MIVTKKILHVTALLACCASLAFAAMMAPASASAATLEDDIQRGDIVKLQAGDWEDEFIVLDPMHTNTNTTGTFLLKKDFGEEKTEFNYWDWDDDTYVGRASFWEGSTAQQWCTSYYDALPESVRSRIVGVKTTETESGYHWAEINNIDGTGAGSKDRAFFLSYREYDVNRDVVTLGGKWLLRTPGSDCTPDMKIYVSVIEGNGDIRNYSASEKFPVRPAFNIDLPASMCTTKTEVDGRNVWSVDLDALDHVPGQPTYIWFDDDASCLGALECSVCGELLLDETVSTTSAVVKEATVEAEGERELQAVFANSAFETQTKTVAIPKLASEGGEGNTPGGTPGQGGQPGGNQPGGNPDAGDDLTVDPGSGAEPTPEQAAAAKALSATKATKLSDAELAAVAVNKSIPTIAAGKISTASNVSRKQMHIKIPKAKGAANYLLAYKTANAKTWTYVATGGKNSYVIKKLKKGSLLQFKVAAVKDGQRGAWSKASMRYFNKLAGFKAKAGSKKLTASWKADSKATAYQVFYSTDKKLKGAKKVTVKNPKAAKCAIKKLAKGKTYYVRARAIKTYKGTNYIGQYSATKKVKVKVK